MSQLIEDKLTRNDSVLDLLPWCREVATYFYNKYAHTDVELEDCISISVVNLYTALDKYEASKGCIKNFALFYINGALLRYLSMITRYSFRLNINDDIISSNLMKEFESSIDGDSAFYRKHHSESDFVMGYKIIELIKKLDSKQRVIIVLFYYESFSIKDIAKVLKVTPSRASQIHRDAINEIKRFL
ncbi:sigma-70 family RNA polymerase sigma factor [Vibrio vulnificus]|nr:sigma-70 family RNA polymerase sigma factor [Vibrio vulnificus]